MDHRCRPKALWYQARRDFAPAACSIADENGEISVWICGNRPEDLPSGQLRIRVLDFAGKTLFEENADFDALGAPGPVCAWKSVRQPLHLGDGRDRIVVADYLSGGQLKARGLRTFANCKDQELGSPKIDVDVSPDGNGSFAITLKADRVVLGAVLTANGDPSPFSDNFLYLLPGEPVTVTSQVGDGIDVTHAAG